MTLWNVMQKNKPWTTSSTTPLNTDRRTDWKEYDLWTSRQYPGWCTIYLLYLQRQCQTQEEKDHAEDYMNWPFVLPLAWLWSSASREHRGEVGNLCPLVGNLRTAGRLVIYIGAARIFHWEGANRKSHAITSSEIFEKRYFPWDKDTKQWTIRSRRLVWHITMILLKAKT